MTKAEHNTMRAHLAQQVNFTLTTEDFQKLTLAAASAGLSRPAFLRQLVRQALEDGAQPASASS